MAGPDMLCVVTTPSSTFDTLTPDITFRYTTTKTAYVTILDEMLFLLHACFFFRPPSFAIRFKCSVSYGVLRN